MNHTFADWNTTVLFDNTNIERGCNDNNNTIHIVIDENNNEYIVIFKDDACYSIDDYVEDYGYVDSKKAISWEDIRLYLKDKGFVYSIIYNSKFEAYDIKISHYKTDSWIRFELTYEEARKEAIQYCLSLIKDS